MIQYIRAKTSHSDFQYLVSQLEKYLREIHGESQAVYDQYNQVEHIDTAIIAYDNQKPVGCGCFKKYDASTAEIKRMFVLADQRGKGIAGGIVCELEKWIKEFNYTSIVLETRKKQVDALRLYEKFGFHFVENYGPYIGMEDSVCMQKNL